MTERGDSPEAPFSELAPLAPLPGPRRPGGAPLGAGLRAQVLGYLPVLLMALLAAATWWLVKNTPQPSGAQGRPPLSSKPDYTMHDFVVTSFAPDGSLRSRLQGEVMQHFPATDTVQVEGVRLRSVDDAGRVTVGSAERAVSNGAATQVQLVGQARVVREPGAGETPADRIEILGDLLEVDTEADRVHSSRPVTVITGQGRVRAGSLDYSHGDRVARLGGRVTGVLPPPASTKPKP